MILYVKVHSSNQKGGDYTLYSENRSQSLFKDADYILGSESRQDINRWHVYIDQYSTFAEAFSDTPRLKDCWVPA